MEYWASLRRFVFNGGVNRSRIVRFSLFGILVVLALAATELAGRLLGLHTPVLYQATSYGYRVTPDQDIRRFGQHVVVNDLGLRNEPVAPLPPAGTLRILCLGDSITNGGAITDQADTYPYILEKWLRAQIAGTEVLNASAPGWAIANEAGWLKENGTFGSQVVVLTIGTLDLFQPLADSSILDEHPSFPKHAPTFALQDLVGHYLIPRLTHSFLADPGASQSLQSPQEAKKNIASLLDMAELARRSGATPVVLFVEQPDRFELSDTQTVAAKAVLFESMKERAIPYMDTRESVEQAGGVALFRDGLHPNTSGNRVLAEVAMKLIAPRLSQIAR